MKYNVQFVESALKEDSRFVPSRAITAILVQKISIPWLVLEGKLLEKYYALKSLPILESKDMRATV